MEINKRIGRKENDPNPVRVGTLLNSLSYITLDKPMVYLLERLDDNFKICLRGLFRLCAPDTCHACLALKDSLSEEIWMKWCQHNGAKPIASLPTIVEEEDDDDEDDVFFDVDNNEVFEFEFDDECLQPKEVPLQRRQPVGRRLPIAQEIHREKPQPQPARNLPYSPNKIPCRYADVCSNKDCLFLHPNEIQCKFGDKCFRMGCIYYHPNGQASTSQSRIPEKVQRQSRPLAPSVPARKIEKSAVPNKIKNTLLPVVPKTPLQKQFALLTPKRSMQKHNE